MAPRKSDKTPVLGSHQKCWLWGRHVVRETLRAGRWPILELHLARNLPEDELNEAGRAAAHLAVHVKIQSPDRLLELCHARGHQGYLARMSLFPYASVAEVLARRPPAPLYAVLDAVQDPQNFGAIIRTAEVFALDALFIAEARQVGVTTAVARASAGAVNRVDVARVDDLVVLADTLRDAGVRLVGATEKAQTPLTDFDFAQPAAVLVGSEAEGIRPALRDRCDDLVRIPQHGAIGSLNAAAAAAILFYEARRQRRQAAP